MYKVEIVSSFVLKGELLPEGFKADVLCEIDQCDVEEYSVVDDGGCKYWSKYDHVKKHWVACTTPLTHPTDQ